MALEVPRYMNPSTKQFNQVRVEGSSVQISHEEWDLGAHIQSWLHCIHNVFMGVPTGYLHIPETLPKGQAEYPGLFTLIDQHLPKQSGQLDFRLQVMALQLNAVWESVHLPL